jgi:ribonuclease R
VAHRPPTRITGRLTVHRDGYGFLIPDQPLAGLAGDVFLPPGAIGGAMHGDRVMVRLVRMGRDGRAEGRVASILERAHPSVVGAFRVMRDNNYVQPHDERLRTWVLIPEGLEIPRAGLAENRIGAAAATISGVGELDGMIVNAEILEYPGKDENPVGRVVEILGRPGDFGVDVEIIIRKHHIPHRFPPEAIEQAQSVPGVIRQRDLEGRRDFRSLEVVTIDGETARDFDDAVWVERLDSGNYALQVHIADVSHYVRPGTPIDEEAERRGNSVYFPDRAVPMLPLELSTGICSLNPQVDRLVMSALLEIDPQGEVVGQEFCRGVIRSVERMTYTDVHLILEGDPGLRERYAPLVGRFELMRELALALNRKRIRRGSIDFDLPEPLIEFDEFGEMTGIGRSPRNIAHRLIEEFMLAANEAVAERIEAAGSDTLYRIHDPPEPKSALEFEQVASQFGVSLGIRGLDVRKFPRVFGRRQGPKARSDVFLPVGDVKITPRHYQRLVKQIEGRPEERILTYLMLRSLKQARYSAENRGHFALAAGTYTHFTSPIRRYPDLIVHRVLGSLLDRQPAGMAPARLQHLARHCSDTERRADDAERELVEWKKIDFMAARTGDEFPALIVNTAPFGFVVELEDLFVEGLVPIETLPGERWGYNESTRQIVGSRSRRRFAIGNRLTVRLDRVDVLERRMYFSVV